MASRTVAVKVNIHGSGVAGTNGGGGGTNLEQGVLAEEVAHAAVLSSGLSA